MSGADKLKAPVAADAQNNTNALNSRIPAAGFTALRHLLDAARQLHQLTFLPDDALKGVSVVTQIDGSLVNIYEGQTAA